MSININQKIWIYVERLYVHCYSAEEFIDFLKKFGIEYDNEIYKKFNETGPTSEIPLYKFMSEENYTFGHFMQGVPFYKYIPILEKIIFDNKIITTKQDNWNYYGEAIKEWYPSIVNLLKIEGITFDEKNKKLICDFEKENETNILDFLPHDFYDMFLDYIRKEINECYKGEQFLAVMILSRKLLEAMFIRILMSVFPKIVNQVYSEENHFIWYYKKYNRYHSFDKLIENTKDNADKFQEDRDLIIEICSLVKPFKDETNLYVHYDYKIPDEKYLKEWRVDRIVEMVRKVYRKYCNP